MDDIYFTGRLNCPVGIMKIIADSRYLLKIEFSNNDFAEKENEITKKAKIQLMEYFNKKRKVFQLPVNIQRDNFHSRVWKLLQNIPYGTTVSYKKLAEMTGNSKAYRAVGNANNKNPLPIIIPCHRVIKNDGSLGGYGGGIKVKKYLINLEKE